MYGCSFEPSPQITRQFLSRRIPAVRFFVQAFVADGLQVQRRLFLQLSSTNRVIVQYAQHSIERVRLLERWPPSEQFVKDRAQGVNVGRRTDILTASAGLLGGHVARRADDRAALRQRRAVFDPLGQAE